MKNYKFKLLVILLLVICGFSSKLYADDDLIRILGLGNLEGALTTPDGKKLVTCGNGGIFVWDISTGDTILSIRNNTGYYPSILISQDGSKIINFTYWNGGSVNIWDTNTGTLLGTLIGNNVDISNFQVSPDGSRIIWCSDSTIYLWNAITYKLIKTLGPNGWVRILKLSPDGNQIVSESDDKTIKLWDAKTGNLITTLFKYYSSGDISFSPDGSKIANNGIEFNIWDTKTDTLITTLTSAYKDISTFYRFNPDGNKILTVNIFNSMILWDANTGIALDSLKGHTDKIYNAFFSSDGTKIISGSYDSTVKVWNANTGKELSTQKVVGAYGNGVVRFSPDGTKFLDLDTDRTIKLWEILSGKLITSFPTFKQNSFGFNSDGSKLISIDSEENIKLWNANTVDTLNSFKGYTQSVYSISYNPDGTKIVSTNGKLIKFWDPKTGENINTFRGHSDIVTYVAYSMDGERILSGSLDGTIKIWDAKLGKDILTINEDYSNLFALCLSPDGNRIASGGRDSTIKIWDVASGKVIMTLTGHKDDITSVCYSLDGSKIASGCYDGTIKIWAANTGKEIITITGHSNWISSLCFSPDGTKITGVDGDNTIKIWDVNTGKELKIYGSLFGVNWYLTCSSFCPDGTKVAGGYGDTISGIIKLWDLKSNVLLKTYSSHNEDISGIAFSPDSKTIASASYDGTIKIWRVPFNNVPTLNIKGTNSTCQNNIENFSTTFTQGISYKWNVSTGGIIIGSDTLSTIKVQFTTSDSTVTISLIDSVNSTGKKDTAYYAIDVYPIPLPTIKSYSIPCYESIQNYYTDWASYYTYKWDITGGTIMGEDSLEFVNVEWTSPTSGTISLTTINYIAGCMGSVSQVIYINQSPRPLINGKQSAYKGSTQQYSAQNNKDSSYEWYAINGTINGNRNLNSVNVVWGNADSGIVKLIETNFKGCVDTVSLVVNLLPVGVDELNNVNESISIFPNPATNELKISYNLNVNKNVTFTIIDILGNVVYSATEQGLAGANNSKIDLSALPQGVYYLKLTTGADAMTRIISVIR